MIRFTSNKSNHLYLHQQRSVALKYASNALAAVLRPGPRWGSSRRSPDPLVGWGGDTPSPDFTPFGASIIAPFYAALVFKPEP